MIYITGDMHGEDARWYDRQLKRLRSGDTLLICGDFGYVWNGGKREKKDLEWLGSRPYSIGFLDGTHENFDLLNTYRQTVWNGGRVHRISGTLFHLIRGQIFTIEGLRFFVFGGGESPDKEIRLEQHSWWREELPSPAEMAEGAENLDEVGLKVDYILTHEPPSMVKSAVLLRSGHTDRVSKLNGYLEEIDRSCAFRHWYFGSIHEDRTITPKHTALFRKIIIAGEDLSNAEDNNFFRNMLGSFRTISRKAPAIKPSLEAKQEAKKKAAQAQKPSDIGQGVDPGVGQAGQKLDANQITGASQDQNAGPKMGANQNTVAAAKPITAQNTDPVSKPGAAQKGPEETAEKVLSVQQNPLSETAAETAGDLLQGAAVLRPAALSRRKEPIPGEGLAFFPPADKPDAGLRLSLDPEGSMDRPDENQETSADTEAAFSLPAPEQTAFEQAPAVQAAVPAEGEWSEPMPGQPEADEAANTPAGFADGGDGEEKA